MSAAVVAVGFLVPSPVYSAPLHPHLHHALHEMREAHKELKQAPHNFGGHRERAMQDLDAAIIQIEKVLAAAGDPFKGFNPGKGIYGDYKNHPHLRHSLVEMRIARKELFNSKLNFGAHKERALRDLDAAIVQVEKCIEHAR